MTTAAALLDVRLPERAAVEELLGLIAVHAPWLRLRYAF
jgi:hypothetical protein